MNTRVLSALVLAVSMSACCSSHVSSDFVPGDADRVIRSLDREFMDGVASANVDMMMNTYADDAVLLPPNAPPQHGRAAIRQFWTGFLAAGKFKLDLVADDIRQSGDMATEIGHYTVTVTPTGTTAVVRDEGKFILAWRKVNGKWAAYADAFSSNNPPPPAQ